MSTLYQNQYSRFLFSDMDYAYMDEVILPGLLFKNAAEVVYGLNVFLYKTLVQEINVVHPVYMSVFVSVKT